MTVKFDNFNIALLDLCKEHNVMIASPSHIPIAIFDYDGEGIHIYHSLEMQDRIKDEK